MATLNIPPLSLPDTSASEINFKKLQNHINTLTEQLKLTLNTLSLDDLGDLSGSITGSMIADGSIEDQKLYSRFMLADTAHFTFATVEQLAADYMNTRQLEAKFATIEGLRAEDGYIGNLRAEVANIGNILAGNVGAGSLQTIVINSVNSTIANATIKSAMIESVNTSQVEISSDDGKLRIADNTIQIKDAARTRVQLGRDAAGDYNLYVWDESGNLMFDAAGLHADGIKGAIIRDCMVASDAGINGSKIYIDMDGGGNSLSVLFSEMGDTVGGLSTSLNAVNGKLDALISETEISEIPSGQTLYGKYSALSLSLDAYKTEVSEHFIVANDGIEAAVSRISAVEQNLDSVTASFVSFDGYIGDGQTRGISSYIRQSMDGIEIGKSGSRIISRFDNDSLEFVDSASSIAIAYITDEKMYITDGEIKNKLLIGGFSFEPRANGNLSLKRRA